MKNNWKLIIGAALLAAAALSSCSKEEVAKVNNADNSNLQTMSFDGDITLRILPTNENDPCFGNGTSCQDIKEVIIRPQLTPHTFQSMSGLQVAEYFTSGPGSVLNGVLAQGIKAKLESGNYRLAFIYEDNDIITYIGGTGNNIDLNNCEFGLQLRK